MTECTDIRPPSWMKRAEKQQFQAAVMALFDRENPPSAAEIARLEDFFHARGRIDLLRRMLRVEARELAEEAVMTETKIRIATLARQLDQAERQSHALAEKLKLL